MSATMDVNYTKSSCPKKASTIISIQAGSTLADVLFIPNMKRYDRLSQQDICYVKGDKSHVTLYMKDGRKVSVSTHLGNFMRYLNTSWFVRTSRSHIVNLRYIEAVTTRSVVIHDKVIPLTEAYRITLWEQLPIVRLKSD